MKLKPVIGRFVIGITALSSITGNVWSAETGGDFYKGKQVTLINGGAPGTVYDTYGRILAEYLPKYIPGNPAIVMQFMAGASGLTAANYVAKQAARDGTVIAAGISNLPTTPLLSPDAVQFDANKLSWIGSITKDVFVGFVWYTAPIKTYEEAKTTEVTMGGTATVGSASFEYAILSNHLFGTKLKLITGYKDTLETKLAIEKGEVNGTFANLWSELKVSRPAWIKEQKVRIITQFGFSKLAELPDIPLFIDQAKTAADRQILELLLARQEFAKPYFAPPEVPADRINILRRAFDATLKDPAFLADLSKAQLDAEGPMTGEQLAAITSKLLATPPDVPKRIDAIFSEYRAKK